MGCYQSDRDWLALGRANILIHSILVFIIIAIRSIIVLNFFGRFLRSARRRRMNGRARLNDGHLHRVNIHRCLSDCVSFDGGMQKCKQNNKLIAVQIVNNTLELRQWKYASSTWNTKSGPQPVLTRSMMSRRDRNPAESSTSMDVRDQNHKGEALDHRIFAPKQLWKFVVLYGNSISLSWKKLNA